MTDNSRFDPSEPARPPSPLGEAIDTAVRRITTGIVIAGAIVGLAVYARPGPPRYDAFAMGERIIRVDMKTGTIISCQGEQTCLQILRRGQRLTRVKRTDAALPGPAPATPLPAAPAAEK